MYVVHQNSLALGSDDLTAAKKDHERAPAENAVAECAASAGRAMRWLAVRQRRLQASKADELRELSKFSQRVRFATCAARKHPRSGTVDV